MKSYSLVLLGLLLTIANSFCADLKLAGLFTDHMVLQRQKPVYIWGWADPGTDVTVKIGTQTASGKSDDKGYWRVQLPPMEANATGQSVTITGGGKTLTLNDVVVGDVWVCSGQSNMQFAMAQASTAKDELPKSANPKLRLFAVKINPAFTPQSDVTGTWQLSGPDSAKGFSAVAYYFGKEIAATENVPVGLLGSYVGGTPAQAWTSLDSLQADPDLNTIYAEPFSKMAADPAALKAAHDAWLANGGSAYLDAMKQWRMADYAAKAKGEPDPPNKPTLATTEPPHEGDTSMPTVLFNGMIAPLQPLAIKGVIWYQGESNGGGATYVKLFPEMIADWRKTWGQGDFPFLWVQLPNYTTRNTDPNGPQGWAYTREVQADGLKIPATGMAVTIDAGDEYNLHPPYKDIVGHRLALAAEHVAYGKDLIYSGPMFESAKVDGAKITVKFSQVGKGLKMEVPQVAPPKFVPPPTDKVAGFAIAGSDKKFVWADASITGPDTVAVSSASVPAPVYVRYAFGTSPEVNLYNSADLPAAPFHTDPTPAPVMPKPMTAAPAPPPAPAAASKPAAAPAPTPTPAAQ
jgi:sialate O-acetylesterase